MIKDQDFSCIMKRRDVVFKTILRQMRKSLTKDFNKETDYVLLRRFRTPVFF